MSKMSSALAILPHHPYSQRRAPSIIEVRCSALVVRCSMFSGRTPSPVLLICGVLNREAVFSTMTPIAMRQIVLATLLFASAFPRLWAEDAPPSDWVDPDTGHRIIRL